MSMRISMIKMTPVVVFLISIFLMFLPAASLKGAPKSDPWNFWDAYDAGSTVTIDHSPLAAFLDAYLVTNHPSGINRVDYGAVTEGDREKLNEYVRELQDVHVRSLNRQEQKAYWINLYNAMTLKVILDHYPVKSIRDIDLTKGAFSDGPWDAPLMHIEGQAVSLNDIEHRILRPLFGDNRIHYAVNCASLGCPNLQPVPYTVSNLEELLNRGAREYISHPRGVTIDGNRMILSSIYKWFQEDFGDTVEGVKEHLEMYAPPDLADAIRSFHGKVKYHYDWSLNDI
jgi:hypothetical protein